MLEISQGGKETAAQILLITFPRGRPRDGSSRRLKDCSCITQLVRSLYDEFGDIHSVIWHGILEVDGSRCITAEAGGREAS
jgi:hypothetical protein